MALKNGYLVITVRNLTIGEYNFTQLDGNDAVSVYIMNDDRNQSLNAVLSLKSDLISGYPPLGSKMNNDEWTQHCRRAKELFDKAGGEKHFESIPPVTLYFSINKNRLVSAEEALEAEW